MYRARILGLPVGAVGPLNGPGQGAAGDITCDLRHSRGYTQIASTSGPDTEQFDDPDTRGSSISNNLSAPDYGTYLPSEPAAGS